MREPTLRGMRPTGMRTPRAYLGALLAALVVAGGLVLVAPGPAYACSCVAGGPRQYVEWADVVVWARVDHAQVPPSAIGGAHYLLDVERVYKGAATQHVQVDSSASSAACGLEGIEEGEAYVFFLQGERPPHSASLCGGTGMVKRAQLERVLDTDGDPVVTDGAAGDSGGEGQPAAAPEGQDPAPGGPADLPVSAWSYLGMGAGVVVALAAAAFWLVRRPARRTA